MSGERRSARATTWAGTMDGHVDGGVVHAHRSGPPPSVGRVRIGRQAREEAEALSLVAGATRAAGGGRRARPEAPDPLRTCFERDRDRILHSAPFRRLAGKTQVFVFPRDHQRTRLTHALEVAQVATAVARAVGLNVALTEAIALGHDCGHGPGGHASEDAFAPFLAEGYDHAIWGADVVLAPLNLCAETLDGIRHHSWSLPTPLTPEGAVVSWADRCAYSAHDLEDAAAAGIVEVDDLPAEVVAVAGTTRSAQLRAFIAALVGCITETGQVGMRPAEAGALAALRRFNYERIYTQPASVAQADAVVAVLTALVELFVAEPSRLPGGATANRSRRPGEATAGSAAGGEDDAVRRAVAYVGGMTDRYAFETAVALLGWAPERLPRGIDVPGPPPRTPAVPSLGAPVPDGTFPPMALAKAKRVDLLGSLPLFERCTRKELAEVAALTVEEVRPEGTVLTREGQTGGLAFVVVEGAVKATRNGRTVGTLGPGDVVGELALIDGGPRSATVTAAGPVRLLELNGDDFRRLLSRSPRFTANLLRTLAGRLRDADRRADMGV